MSLHNLQPHISKSHNTPADTPPMYELPVELIQKIIRHLPQKDRVTVSQLSKRLNGFTKDVVFNSIYMKDQEAVDRWGDLSKDFRAWIMNRCQSLSCTIDTFEVISDSDKYLIFFAGYLNHFKTLTSLHLAKVSLVDPRFIEHSQPHIKELTLRKCYSTLEAFATLVDKFPNLTHLTLIEIHDCSADAVAGSPPQLSNSPPESSRKLSIADFFGDVSFLNIIFSVPWDEVSILEGTGSDRLDPQCFIDHASRSLKRLDVQDNKLPPKSTLEYCEQLCELSVRWTHDHMRLISTIKSTEIRKITITRLKASWLTEKKYQRNLDPLDQVLCKLVERLELRGRLEVEIQLVDIPKNLNILGRKTDHLPGFRNVGGRVNFAEFRGENF